MGDYDFLSGLDLGDLGGGIAGGANTPNLGDLSGLGGANFNIPNFTVPQFSMPAYQGIMNGISIPFGDPSGGANIPNLQLPGQAPIGDASRSMNMPNSVNNQSGGATPPTPTPDQGGGGFNLGNMLKPAQGVLQGITGLAGLGVSGLGVKASLDAARNARDQAGIQRGFQKNQQQLQQTQAKSIAPLQQFGTNQLQQASAGQVDPAIQAYIDQWAQAEKVKMQQQFARLGLTNSPMFQSALGQIDKQALAMKSSVIGQDKQTAIQALQGAMGGTVGAMGGANAGAMVANQEQNQLDNLIRSSQAALAQLNAMAK